MMMGGGMSMGGTGTSGSAGTAGSGGTAPDPCIGVTCAAHQTCKNENGTAMCDCSPQWSGANCDVCATGYVGADCSSCDTGYYEIPAASGLCVDPCSPNPCLHAGTCAKDTGAAVCTCHGAWGGAVCDDIYFGDPSLKNEARLPESNASCHEDSFLDLTDWLPDPNANLSDPTLSVSCTASTMSVESNSVPQYKIAFSDPKIMGFANTLIPTDTTYNFPLTPVFNQVPKQATVVGGVGVAINGVQISSPSASGGQLKYADPAEIEVDSDTCKGHPNPSGKYHYHSMKPSCFFKNTDNGNLVGKNCTAPSPIVGWIADGYPIYGPCECLDKACTQVVEMRSSYVMKGGNNDPSDCAYQDYTYVGDPNEYSDGDEYLDECSGHIGPNGDYHYHMTNEYPWTLRCYRGNPNPSMAMGHTYNNAAGGNDCCFEKQCIAGVYQSNVSCMAASCQ
jgi:hypothetical protein